MKNPKVSRFLVRLTNSSIPLKIKNMPWLQGGPYYELSFLMTNSENRIELLKEIVKSLLEIPNFQIVNTVKEIEAEIENYSKGIYEDGIVFRTFELKATSQVAGERQLRLHITELSSELIKLNFWFFGSLYDAKEWNQKGIKTGDKPEFKGFFHSVKKKLNPICGTIAYEEDIEELFVTDILSPNEYFSTINLNIETIRKRLTRTVNEYEYFWVAKGEIGNKDELELEIKNVTG